MNLPIVLYVPKWTCTINFCKLHSPSTTSFVEGECQLDDVPDEVAPCEEWLPEEVELNTVTISNMSLDSKPVETDG